VAVVRDKIECFKLVSVGITISKGFVGYSPGVLGKNAKKQYTQNRKRSASYVPDTCYNKICDTGENVRNCPEDCCQTVNRKCTWNTKCLPECCGESTCCESSSGNSWRMQTSLVVFSVILLSNVSKFSS
jgi:hypothetical protein